MINLQSFIFDTNPSRIELLNYSSQNHSKPYKISVYRNHSFEMIEHTISAYLDYANINVEFQYSDYDDSLSFLNLDTDSDLLILWLDLSRYNDIDIVKFLNERIEYLTTIYKKNILFVPFGIQININNSNIIVYDLEHIKNELKNNYTDERLEKFSGTKLSPKAAMLISRDLGLNYIPALLQSSIKAIVFDLDNTLYKGVLGEDGYKNIELTPAHKKLQEKIADFSKQGFFICIASKNEYEDVINMFKNRNDFPLKLEHITKMCVSWKGKDIGIKEIQKFLNIGIKDILFVDDNIGEIASVKTAYPDINIILANDNAEKTLEVLNNYPRLMKFGINYEDSIRKGDIQANEQRELLKNTLSIQDFLKTLDIEITYSLNDLSQIKRIAELSNKTNQFICSYKRYSEAEIEELMNNENNLIISSSLKDKLSDSGIIGVMVFENKKEYVEVVEAFISCRALGRGIDENIIIYPIQLAMERFNNNRLLFSFTKGERNTPAEEFINNNLQEYKNKTGIFNKQVKNDFINIHIEEKINER